MVQEASRLKDEFLASLSHELRTPLNAVLGYARMLRTGIITPDKHARAIDTIERNATSLSQIVEDVLDISRIISGKLRLNVQPVEFPKIVEDAIDVVTPAAEAKGVRMETVLGALPALAIVAVVVLGLSWGAGLLRWLGVSQGAAAVDGRLKLWLVPYALLGAGAIAFVIFGRRLQPRLRSRWLGSFIAADLVVFTLLSVVAVRPGLVGGGTVAGHGTAAAGHGTAAPGHGSVAAARSGGRAGAQASAVRPVGALGYPGRFAIYDPDELGPGELPVLGAPDLNVISGTPSIQGYTSLVDGRYASVTGSHRATGEGQDVLSPRAVGAGILDQRG